MKYIRTIIIQLLILCFFWSCKVHSSGRTQLNIGEKFTISTDTDSKSNVKIHNLSSIKLLIYYNDDTISLAPLSLKKIKLKEGEKVEIINDKNKSQEIQVRFLMILNNKATVTRTLGKSIKNENSK